MRPYYLLICLISLVSSCNSLKKIDPKIINCPAHTICNTEKIQDQQIQIVQDKFDKPYLVYKESEGLDYVKTTFSSSNPAYEDSQIIEEFFIPTQILKVALEEDRLPTGAVLLYGKLGNFRNGNIYKQIKPRDIKIRNQAGKTYINLYLEDDATDIKEITLQMD